MREDRAVTDVPLRGRLLVATPPLVDPNFDRTVVLILEHGDEGALGLVLNRPGDAPLIDAVPEWSPFGAEPSVVFAGGPVSPESVIALAQATSDRETDGWIPIIDSLGTVDLAREPVDIEAAIETVRVFVGYAGWAPGQLEGELDRGAWFVCDFDVTDAFSADPETLWNRVLRRQGGRLAMFANCPADPSTN
jgi:putative transcriptional regulator